MTGNVVQIRGGRVSIAHRKRSQPNSNRTTMADDKSTLEETLAQFAIELAREQTEQLEQYCHLLWDWNTKLNLTRHTDFAKFVSRDLVDTLELSKLLHPNEEIMDVGTGGGVPGIVLAVLRPDLQITLCESVGKKCQALNAMLEELGLPVTLFHARAESLLDDFRFDATIARAVGPLWKMCYWFRDHWLSVGRLLAVKGPNWLEERKEARHRGLLNGVELRKVASYPLVGTDSESVILKLWPKGAPER